MASRSSASPAPRSRTVAARQQPHALPAALPSRVVIQSVEPAVDSGRYPAKHTLGEPLRVTAIAFADGHDHILVDLLWRNAGASAWRRTPMQPLVNDHFAAEFSPSTLGTWQFTVEGHMDRYGTWLAAMRKLFAADRVTPVDLQEGAALLLAASERADAPGDRAALEGASHAVATSQPANALEAALAVESLMRKWQDRGAVARYPVHLEITVERERARHGAWYELFPRSLGQPGEHGMLRDVESRLPGIAAMGFDVLYLPPISPIGTSHRKGPNNSLTPAPGDPGSPWAIGSKDGGHTAIHPELGTLDDFLSLVNAAHENDIEIALDIAFQCSPDHPWITEHPGWFRHLPDGSIRSAENPPKKYEDIVPFDFECEEWQALWTALRDVMLTWAERGVRIFRVDNPHTKPVAFWEWAIRSIRETHPEAIFLAEAFTRPAMLQGLARAGFSQSYTYFTWRNTRNELIEFMTELTTPPVANFLRPNLWPNTPDILPESLQSGGRPAFVIRLVLAATLGANYGIYGPAFELAESQPRDYGSEEYLNSEKYQLRDWNIHDEWSLRDTIARVNTIRREHPALLQDRTLHFHATDNDRLIAYSKQAPGGDTILVVVSLDPHYRQAGHVTLDLDALGLSPDSSYQVHDLLGDGRFPWRGARNYVEFDPQRSPVHIFALRSWARSEQNFEYYL